MVAQRIRLAQVVATSLNPFSDYHVVVDRFRSPVQFACGRTRPLDEVHHWFDEDPLNARELTEVEGTPICRQCRRSAGWPLHDQAHAGLAIRAGAPIGR